MNGVGLIPKNRRRNQADATPKRPRIPNYRNEEILGVVTEIYGGEHMSVKGEDGTLYMGLIRGKIKKRMWTRVGDLVILSPWYFETEKEGKKRKAHIIWRYTRTQSTWLQNHNYIKKNFLEDMQNI
ncbi:translation initiation factor eIF-1A [Candidatus Lokiarchaeum ossiferum]|uniref:translation initiation factor eIF-1A n=1 Tax=Candidatus Lokiarchaeum ossiferum TaxID=2951803 RepID=UPI00352BF656